MKEFVLIFRANPNPNFKPSEEQAQQMMTSWIAWIADIEAKSQMVNRGTRLGISDAKVVRPENVVTNGPFSEVKEFINGFTIVKTNSIAEAVKIAKECPIVKGGGGSVEVRAAVASDDNS